MKYKVTFNANNAIFKAKGETIFEAVSDIPLSSLDLKTKSDIIVKYGQKTATKHFSLFQGRALLRNHLRRAGFTNQLEALLR